MYLLLLLLYAHICTHICVCIYTYIRVYIHICISEYIFIHSIYWLKEMFFCFALTAQTLYESLSVFSEFGKVGPNYFNFNLRY